MELNLAAKVVEKITRGSREDDLGAKPKNVVTKILLLLPSLEFPR